MRQLPLQKFQFKRFLSLIRAIFPRWDFFDQVAYSFELQFKVPGSNQWIPLSFNSERKIFSLLANPQTNMTLAKINIIEHFSQDIQDLQKKSLTIESKEVHKLTSFQLINSILYEKIQDFEFASDVIQFKVIAKNSKELLDIYISDWIKVTAI